ncbi:dipeptidase [Aristophania vespae]|uniref:dipeptidase n=1 Tax=Aristophania vespae TaxID=2697033 RepID=UPI002351138C|nr:dipeptidase [Aristophania vespae]UMM64754.1 hypothetical protein DM15PD_17740 [Aristophania vespae]
MSKILTFDTHIDIPWPEKTAEGLPAWKITDPDDLSSLWQSETKRRFTLPKAQEGGLDAVCLVAYSPQGPLTKEGHEAAWKRVNAMLKTIQEIPLSSSSYKVKLCLSADDVNQAFNEKYFSITPVIENGYVIGENIENIQILSEAYGVRYITLTHNGHNLLADSAIPKGNDKNIMHGGLSELGKEAIKSMNKAGIVVDISHASRDSMMQAVSHSDVPVVASHSSIKALCDHPRNLDDKQLQALAEAGGVVQITAMSPFLKRGGGATLAEFMAHIRYAVDLIGIDHVGLSSDFDGGGGIKGWSDASQTAQVTKALEIAGFDNSEIRALWGGNMLRLLKQAEIYSQTAKK